MRDIEFNHVLYIDTLLKIMNGMVYSVVMIKCEQIV